MPKKPNIKLWGSDRIFNWHCRDCGKKKSSSDYSHILITRREHEKECPA